MNKVPQRYNSNYSKQTTVIMLNEKNPVRSKSARGSQMLEQVCHFNYLECPTSFDCNKDGK
jgi:hypothetical protein